MIPITYLIIYGELKRKANHSVIVHITKIKEIVKWRVRIPKRYRYQVIEELCEMKLLKKIGKGNYEILKCNRCAPYDSLGTPFW